MVRIRYWYQETTESGRWCLTGLMSEESAHKIIRAGILERGEIVSDSDYPEILGYRSADEYGI